MAADKTDGGYEASPRRGTDENVRHNVDKDATRIETSFRDKDASDAAAVLLRETSEAGLKGASPAERQQYLTAMEKRLQESGILPEVALAYGRTRRDLFGADGKLDEGKLVEARIKADANPQDKLTSSLLSAFEAKYKELKTKPENYRGVTGESIDAAVKAGREERITNERLKPVRDEAKQNLGGLLDPQSLLFKKLSDGDTFFRQGDVEKFRKELTALTPEGEKLRKEFGDAAAVKKALDTTDALLKAFKEGKPAAGEPNSLMGMGMFSRPYMDRDTLARGMGYKDAAEGQRKLPEDLRTIAGGTRPVEGVTPVRDYNTTRLPAGKGPEAMVRTQVLPGDENSRKVFGNDPRRYEQARKDLEEVFKPGGPFFKDKGKPELTAENRDAVIAAIKKLETDRAKGGEPDHTLSNWFATRYPKPSDAPATAPTATPERRIEAKVGNRGAWGVSTEMVKGQNLSETDRQVLQSVIGNKAITGVDLMSARAGTEIVNAGNVEKIRAAIEEKGSTQLKEWFARNYPKNRGPR